MSVLDLHTLDISTPLYKLFNGGGKTNAGAVLSLVPETPQINVGANVPLVMGGRAKGALVHEGGVKPDNGRAVTPKPFTTVKLVYSQRVSDEFMQWTRERQQDFVAQLINDWMTKSIGRDIDTVVLHGRDPHSGELDTELSDYMSKEGSSILIPSTGTTATDIDADLTSAIEALNEKDADVNGVALSTDAAGKLSTIVEGGVRKYTGLSAFGLEGNNFSGRRAASTPEVGEYNSTELVLGDWSQLLLGFAGQAAWRVHTAGDPDGTGVDLASVNQVLIRLETKFGFRILDGNAFARVATAASPSH